MEENVLLTGIGASPGIIIGKAMLVDRGRPDFSHVRLVSEEDIEQQISFFIRPLRIPRASLNGPSRRFAKRMFLRVNILLIRTC
jgi:hypothetical protein